jgi:phosphatidylserine/phosphatidylglycerophosphate/cardiolipin synthase-like enzyme
VLIDDGQLFVGSSNLTASGLQLGIQGNLECGTMMEPTEADRATIRDLFDSSVRVTPSLYLDIKASLLPSSRRRNAATSCSRPP